MQEHLDSLKLLETFEDIKAFYEENTGKPFKGQNTLSQQIQHLDINRLFVVETILDPFSHRWETGIRLGVKKSGKWSIEDDWNHVQQYMSYEAGVVGHNKWMIWAIENPESGLPNDIRKDWQSIEEVWS